jgi:hypothetical protein
VNANPHAQILGLTWLVLGAAVALYLKLSGRSLVQSDT